MDEEIIVTQKKKSNKKKLDDFLNEDNVIDNNNYDVSDYKNKLRVYAASGQIKDLYGKIITDQELNNLSEHECENIHKICELKIAAKISDSVIEGIVTVIGNLCSKTLPIENKEKYISDLKNDYIIINELKSIAGKMTMRTGKLMGLLSFAIITVSNINMYRKTVKQIDKEIEKESKELDKELVKEIEKELEK